MSSTDTRFAEFTLLRKLAVGGMAEIYLARQDGMAGFAKHLVIKRIHGHLNRDPEFVSMFLDEARLVARLSHPNIASVHDFGKHEDAHYLVMEYVHGVPLSQAIKRSKGIEPAHALRIVSEICAGLHYAHQAKDDSGESLGIIHRDVSPQNVLLSYDGSVKLIDFGVAKATTQAHETRAGAFKGKYAYMSPEQAAGRRYDHRADQHAVGIVLWEMLTGRGLFHRSNAWDSMQAVLSQHAPSVRRKHPELPPEIDAIIARTLAKDPAERYESCGVLQGELDEYAAGAGLFSSSMRLGQYVRDLFDIQSSTGEFRDHDLRQKTDVSAMPEMPELRDEEAEDDDAEGVAAEPEAVPTGDYEPGSFEVVVEEPGPGGEEADTAEEQGLGAEATSPSSEEEAAEAAPSLPALTAASERAEREDATAPRTPPPWTLPPTADEPVTSPRGETPVPPGAAGPLAAPAAAEKARRGSTSTWLLLGFVGIAVGVLAGFFIWRAGSTAGSSSTARVGALGSTADSGTSGAEPSSGDAGEPPPLPGVTPPPAVDPGREPDAGPTAPDPALPTGFLTVSSEPSGALVWVDGRSTGERTSVRDLPLDPGSHTVELTLEGRERWRKTVDVALGETLRLRAKLDPAPGGRPRSPPAGDGGPVADEAGPVDYGLLSVDTTPPSRVRIDGRDLGQTPIRGEEVPAGAHRLSFVTQDGRSFVRTVTVAAGRSTRRTFDLDAPHEGTAAPEEEGPPAEPEGGAPPTGEAAPETPPEAPPEETPER